MSYIIDFNLLDFVVVREETPSRRGGEGDASVVDVVHYCLDEWRGEKVFGFGDYGKLEARWVVISLWT